MHVFYVFILCIQSMYSVYVFSLCLPSMYSVYVFILWIQSMYSFYVFILCIECIYSMYLFYVCMYSMYLFYGGGMGFHQSFDWKKNQSKHFCALGPRDLALGRGTRAQKCFDRLLSLSIKRCIQQPMGETPIE